MPRRKPIKYYERFSLAVWGLNIYSVSREDKYLYIITDRALRSSIIPREMINGIKERNGTTEKIATEIIDRLNFEIRENQGTETDQTKFALKLHKELYDRERI